MTRIRLLLAVGLTGVLTVLGSFGSADAAVTHQQINGSGSSWSANAINQWITDVNSSGLHVVFTPSGSAQGRKDFTNKTTDYGVSDIGYQGQDSATGDSDTNCTNPNDQKTCRSFAYLPVVAGGTSFPYQVRVGGQLVKNIRLSGKTLAEIFTNELKPMNWNNPQITADNNGHALPSLPIIPVVHSEGSGSTAQFTSYLSRQYPAIWGSYKPNNGSSKFTEYFPRQNPQVAQNGSDGVMNFLTSSAANGAIAYDEFSYAKQKGYPVIKLENEAGYFTAPTQYNVAVALTKAKINMDQSSPDYLLQKLDQVYTNPDKRAYAMSSYSYTIIPTGPSDATMNTAKRQTLSDFLFYSICGGQAAMGPIGYSPLPINLVKAGFAQISKLHQADKNVVTQNRDVTHCNNPTFDASNIKLNRLAQIAPEPPACDKAGAGPCDANAGLQTGNPTKNGKVPGSSGGSDTTKGVTAGGSAADTGTASATGGGGPSATSGSGGASGITGPSAQTGTGTTTDTGAVLGALTDLAASSNGGAGKLLGILAAVEILAILIVPPIFAHRLRHRRSGNPS